MPHAGRTAASGRGWPAAVLPALVLLAFLLRVYHLGVPSLWYDEAISVYYAARDLPALFASLTQDNHPPLYFLLLHLWLALTGRSEFALRVLSVASGLLAVPLIYVVARRLFGQQGKWAGASAALLVGASPWHVWYSQETRMYSLAATLALLATYIFLRAWVSNRWRQWLAYALVAAAGLYTHYYVALVLLGHAVSFLAMWTLVRRPQPLLRWAGGQVAIVVLFLPWTGILLARAAGDATYWPGTMAFAPFLLQTATAFTVGHTLGGAAAGMAVAAAVLLAAAGLGALLLRARSGAPPEAPTRRSLLLLAFLLCNLAVPVLVLYGLVAQRPKFDPRYLLPASPALYLAMGGGVAALLGARRTAFRPLCWLVAGTALGLWLNGAGQALANVYFDDEYARDDFRGAARYVAEKARPGDAVVVVSGHAQVLFAYYRLPGLAVYPLPNWLVPNLNEILQPATVAAALNEVAAQHARIWLVLWQNHLADPADLVLHQIWANSTQVQLDRGFRGVDLRLYAFAPQPFFDLEPPAPQARAANFDQQVELRGFAADRTSLPAGETLAVTLYWRALAPLADDLTVFVHLLDTNGQVVAQIDRRPVNDFYTTSRWQPGQVVRDGYKLTLPSDIAPGQYLVEIGLYRYPSLARLRLVGSGEDRVIVLPVQVERPAPPAVPSKQ